MEQHFIQYFKLYFSFLFTPIFAFGSIKDIFLSVENFILIIIMAKLILNVDLRKFREINETKFFLTFFIVSSFILAMFTYQSGVYWRMKWLILPYFYRHEFNTKKYTLNIVEIKFFIKKRRKWFCWKKLTIKINLYENSVTIISRKNFVSKAKLIIADLIIDTDKLKKLFIEYDIIFNCSGELNNEDKMNELRSKSLSKIIDFLSKFCLKNHRKIRWIQVSSIGVYGFDKKKALIDENSEKTPQIIMRRQNYHLKK